MNFCEMKLFRNEFLRNDTHSIKIYKLISNINTIKTRLIHKFMLLLHFLININLLLIRVFISISYQYIKNTNLLLNLCFFIYIFTIMKLLNNDIKWKYRIKIILKVLKKYN